MAPKAPLSSIVFFDGTCGLCDRFVSFLLARDHSHHLYFAPLQGEAARIRLPAELLGAEGPLKTVVLMDPDGIHTHSEAAIRAISRLGGPWSAVWYFRLVPRFLRDAVYDFVARNRYSWFGRLESCRLPSLEERARFLN